MKVIRSDFACKCSCGQDTVDYELAEVLQDLSSHFNAVILVHSGNRCDKHNKAIGGAKRSLHLTGKAADIVLPGIEPIKVYQYLANKYIDRYGIGSYESFTHIDVRQNKARW